MTVNFKGVYLDKRPVTKIYPDKTTGLYVVPLVEMQPVSINDMKTLKDVAELWRGDTTDTFVTDIADDFDNVFRHGCRDRRFIAITNQRRNFNKLHSENAMGVIEFTRHTAKKYWIDYVQVSPEFEYFYENRTVKDVGKALINYLKEILPQKELWLNSVLTAIPFYEKMGFERVNDLTMVFRPKKI